jgi:hypothetical protein
MNITYGNGGVYCDENGYINILIKFNGNILIPEINTSLNVKLKGRSLLISGSISGNSSLLFKYFGEFKIISALDLKNKNKIKFNNNTLTLWGYETTLWDEDTSMWGDKDITYTHVKKIKRRFK